MKCAACQPLWTEFFEKWDITYIEQQVVRFDIPQVLEGPEETCEDYPTEDADAQPLNDFFQVGVHAAARSENEELSRGWFKKTVRRAMVSVRRVYALENRCASIS